MIIRADKDNVKGAMRKEDQRQNMLTLLSDKNT